MGVLYKVNIQTFSNGFLLGVGTYDETRIGNSKTFIETYCQKQKELPFEKRDIPPKFEIIDTNKVSNVDGEKQDVKFLEYSKMSKKELIQLCKQRGLNANKHLSQQDLVLMLIESDKNEVSNNVIDSRFKSSDEFVSMDVENQIAYLDSIFSLPDNIEEGSDEESEYISALEMVVTAYGGMSVTNDVVAKIKEILDYINGEE